MGFLKVVSHSGNSLIIELYNWNGKEHVCVGKFEIQAVENDLNISATNDWKTNHRNDIFLSHFSNEPKIHLENLGIFHSLKIREVPSTDEKLKKKKET